MRGNTARSIFRMMMRILARLLFRVRIQGDTSQFNKNHLLIVANHESFLDGLLLGLFLPVKPVFIVHTVIAGNRWFRMILSLVDYLAVDPTSPMAMKQVVKLIHGGRPVVIFPEGRITVTGSLMKVYDGPGFVAAKSNAEIVPVRLDGAARSYFSRLSGNHPRSFFPKITLTVLPATRISMPEGGTAKMRRRQAGEAMRRLMQDMLFASRPSQTLFDALLETTQLFGKRRRLLEDLRQVEYSYADLLRMTLMLGRLVCRYTRQGEHVGLLLPNMAPTLALFFGLGAFRRVPAMLNYTAGSDALQASCSAAGINILITSRAFLDQGKLHDKVNTLPVRTLYLEDLQTEVTWPDRLWWLFFACKLPHLAKISGASPEDIAVILFTSGSEGSPKGVALSHRAILANIAQIRAVVDFSVDDKILNALPIFHSFGLTAGTLLPVLTGASLFLYPSPLHYRIIPELVYDRNCTVLFGTNTFLANYARFAHPYDFFRLRYVIAGAEKLSQSVRETWFERFGIRIFEGYGATETAPVLAVNTPMAYRSGTVGQLLPGIDYRLIPIPGIERGGILHVSGPNLMSGYYRSENPLVLESPQSSIGQGWYDTGDVVEMDEEGFVRVSGRVKRFAKIAGEMISLEVVEKMAAITSTDFPHAVSTRMDPQRGESLVLFTLDPQLTRERLLETARTAGYSEIAVPRQIVHLDNLPLLGTGKIDYVRLKSMAETV